ncbi:hypothetical protein [[Ruminococcus] torques]|uniref:hypothetical protein n=1 Tax=[Ruminococcus] torques TaxID=33039 RepID=UPI0027BB117E|nr:hypothetical protein [[Ruminococcus] torques]
MSRMSELSQVLDEMIACGEGMIKAANAIKDIFSSTEEAPEKKNPSQPRKLLRLLNRLKERKHRNLPIPRKMFVQYSLPNQPPDIRRKSKSFLRNMVLSS